MECGRKCDKLANVAIGNCPNCIPLKPEYEFDS